MKVLFQNRADALTNRGGDTTQMLETKRHLEEMGMTVDVCLDAEPDLSGYEIAHIFNIQLADYGVRQMRNAKRQKKPVALSTIYWDMRHIYDQPDLYLFHHLDLIRSLAKIDYRIPALMTKLKWRKFNNEMKAAARVMLQEADILLPNSYAELEILALLFNLPEARGKALMVPNGISERAISLIENAGVSSPDPSLPAEYVLQVGRLEFIKGQLNLIRALCATPEIPLVFVGRDDPTLYGQACRDMGKERGNTFFFKEVPYEQVYDFYLNARVHALPSLRESPGLVALEAGVCRVNCVVTIHSPVSEYFGLDAFPCDPCNVGSIRQAVLDAWGTPKNSRLRDRILGSFTWRHAAAATKEAYEILVRRSGR